MLLQKQAILCKTKLLDSSMWKLKNTNKQKHNINNGFNKSHPLGHSVLILATTMAHNLNAPNKLMFLNTISKKRIFIIKCCTEGPMLRTKETEISKVTLLKYKLYSETTTDYNNKNLSTRENSQHCLIHL